MSQSTFQFGRCSLDLAEHRLFRDGRLVRLTPRVFDLLRVLVENAGHLVAKERLLKEVWNDAVVEEGNLNRSISVLRKALGETESERYIETVPKRGYRFVAAVRQESWDADLKAAGTLATRSIARPRATTVAVLLIGAVATVAGLYSAFARSEPVVSGDGAAPPVHRQLTFAGKEITPALSPDGSRIAFVSKEAPDRKLVVQDVVGGRQTEIFGAPEVGGLRWAPDGSELMFWARGGGRAVQYIASAGGGSARKLADGSFVSCWSPDGSTVALALFVSGRIIFLNKLGEVQRNISLQGTRDWIWDLDWSRVNGRLLVVADDQQRRPAIWTIRPDGSTQTKAFTGTTEILAARWAPGGDAIYYFTRVNQTMSLYKLPLDASGPSASGDPVLLMSGLETDEGFGISADGTRLVFSRAPYYANLWLVEAGDARTGGRPVRQTQLTRGTAVIERPRVSPDGSTIVFNMGYESRTNLYTIPATGGSPKQLTFLDAFSVDGAWSPDGRSVAFASTEGGKARLWLVNADGSSPRPLPSGDMSESFDVTWSPGARILYQQTGNRNLYVVDPQNPKARLLIKDGSVGWYGSAEYSPDGKKIAVSWNRRPVRGVWLIDAEDSRETLVLGARRPSDPYPYPIGWSPDGKFILAYEGKRAAYRGITASFEETLTAARILRVPVAGGSPETVMTLPFDEVGSIAVFPDGRRFAVSVYSSRSDVWVVDNFDAALRSQGR
jgi:Tol biopolymer transport system component/DNA-binding winged helix-turn-helix (wHTH) protein